MSATTQTINRLNDAGGLKGVDIANLAQVDKGTVSRWKNGKASPNPNMQLVLSDLKYVVDCLSEFYRPDEVRTWLQSRNRLLNGERAINLIYANRTKEVIIAIEQLNSHAFL